jgi:hypothetical protein
MEHSPARGASVSLTGVERAGAGLGERIAAAIERAVARALVDARHAVGDHLSPAAAQRAEADLLERLERGEQPGRAVRVHHLERHADRWAALVPSDPDARAQIVHALAARYPLHVASVPRLASNLGLDDSAVAQAYRERFGEALSTALVPGLSPADRLRGGFGRLCARIETLSPFWMVTVLVTTVSLPAALLGLPVAAAALGPLPAVALVAVLGGAMTLTTTAFAETIVRSGPFRAGKAFLAKMIEPLIGGGPSRVQTVLQSARTGLALLAAAIGLGVTMSDLTDVPRQVWELALGIGLVALLRRGTRATLDAIALVGLITIALIGGISVVGLLHLHTAYLDHHEIPGIDAGVSLDDTLGQAAGVVLMQFIGSIYLLGIGKVSLPRDPGGRSLIGGAALGTGLLAVIAALWLVAVGGAVPPSVLADQAGTAIGPLADRTGTVVSLLGGLTVLLLLGLSANRTAGALHDIAREQVERLPAPLRFPAAVAPVVATILAAEALASSGASFSDVMTIAGVVINFAVGGMFPLLMLVGARRFGELVPERAPGWIGSLIVVVPLYLFFFAALVAFGLFVWDPVGERVAALGSAAVMVWVTVAAVRHLRRRAS